MKTHEALAVVLDDMHLNGRRSVAESQTRVTRHLLPYFADKNLTDITMPDLLRYARQRHDAGASNATVNREVAILKRAFVLAGLPAPRFRKLKESPPRSDFLDPPDFEKVCFYLPSRLRAVFRFGYITGWRLSSEVVPLRWAAVDWKANVVRLAPGVSKTGEPRAFPLVSRLHQVLVEQYERQQREGTIHHGLVFTRRNGKPLGSVRWAWNAACRRAECACLIHGLRRSAARNLIRAGVPERMVMLLCGWRSPSMLARYNIVNERDVVLAMGVIDKVGL